MPVRYLVIVLLLIAATGWWLLREDAAAKVRAAHEELAGFVNRSEEDSDSIAVLELRRLQALFADPCAITGDADLFAGNHSPQELIALMIAVRAALRSVSLEFGELAIDFPDETTTVTRFAADLHGEHSSGELVTEHREVETRMHEVDGEWRFAAFHFE